MKTVPYGNYAKQLQSQVDELSQKKAERKARRRYELICDALEQINTWYEGVKYTMFADCRQKDRNDCGKIESILLKQEEPSIEIQLPSLFSRKDMDEYKLDEKAIILPILQQKIREDRHYWSGFHLCLVCPEHLEISWAKSYWCLGQVSGLAFIEKFLDKAQGHNLSVDTSPTPFASWFSKRGSKDEVAEILHELLFKSKLKQ